MQRSCRRAAATLVALLGFVLGRAVAGDFDDAAVYEIKHPAWFKESFLNLHEDLAEARQAGKQGLLLFFTTQGCSYCSLFLKTSLADPTIAARIQEHFDTIGLEIFDDAEVTDFAGKATPVKQFALDQGVEFAPTLLFYDDRGKLVLRLTGYYEPERFDQALDYVIGRHYEQQPYRAWLADRTAAEAAGQEGALIEDPLFAQPPYALNRSRMRADRPLLVIFERGDCPRCERFHAEVLADPEVRAIVGQMEVVRLDAGDDETPVITPAGDRTRPAQWAQTLGFTQYPALVFFDEGGRQVLETDALVLKQRMTNSLGFVTERAYDKGWTYQRFARSRALAKGAAARADTPSDQATSD